MISDENLEKLIERKAFFSKHEAEMVRQLVLRLYSAEAALKDIARQMTTKEAEENDLCDDGELGDMEYAYEAMIGVARQHFEKVRGKGAG